MHAGSSSADSAVPVGAIVGAAAGGTAALALAAFVWLRCRRRRRLARKQALQSASVVDGHPAATFPTRPHGVSPVDIDSLLTATSVGGSAASAGKQVQSKGSSTASRCGAARRAWRGRCRAMQPLP